MGKITHVLRGQEHLMNTPRQMLVYEALGLPMPSFGHMPLILAPDRSKLSKRHGAVAVGDYQKNGYLASGLVNYLAQLGWNDGTDKEIYQIDELVEAFTLDRMSKVASIFDNDKFKWVNGHHIRLLSQEELHLAVGDELVRQGVVKDRTGEFVMWATSLLRERISVISEAADILKAMLHFDLDEMMSTEIGKTYLKDGSLQDTAKCIVEAHDRGSFDALGSDPKIFKNIAKEISDARGGVKKKALLEPIRLCLTSRDHGPNMADFLGMLMCVDDNVLHKCVPLDHRIDRLRHLVTA